MSLLHKITLVNSCWLQVAGFSLRIEKQATSNKQHILLALRNVFYAYNQYVNASK